MMRTHANTGTADRPLLLRYLHAELEPQERRLVETHVAQCADCRTVLHSMSAQADFITRALTDSDIAQPDEHEWRAVRNRITARAPAGWRSQPDSLLRRAAAVMLIAGAATAAASPPLRAWISERWQAISGEAPAPQEPSAADAGTASVGFIPDRGTVAITFATSQAGGSLRVRFTSGENAQLAVTGGGDEQLALGGSRVRVTNRPDARSSYELDLPATVHEIHVQIGTASPIALSRSGMRDAEIDLATGRVRNPPARGN